jgi:hypothetical protein
MLYFFFSVIIAVFFFSLSYRLVSAFLESRKIFQIINNFESYNAVLQFVMKKAYDITYKDKLLVYSLEATKIDERMFEPITKDFVNLTIKLLGPRLQKEFIYLFGNEETFLFNIVDYFNNSYENDEIRKTQQEKLMSNEETT